MSVLPIDGKRGVAGMGGWWIDPAEALKYHARQEQWWGPAAVPAQSDSTGPPEKPVWLFENGNMYLGSWITLRTTHKDNRPSIILEDGFGITYHHDTQQATEDWYHHGQVVAAEDKKEVPTTTTTTKPHNGGGFGRALWSRAAPKLWRKRKPKADSSTTETTTDTVGVVQYDKKRRRKEVVITNEDDDKHPPVEESKTQTTLADDDDAARKTTVAALIATLREHETGTDSSSRSPAKKKRKKDHEETRPDHHTTTRPGGAGKILTTAAPPGGGGAPVVRPPDDEIEPTTRRRATGGATSSVLTATAPVPVHNDEDGNVWDVLARWLTHDAIGYGAEPMEMQRYAKQLITREGCHSLAFIHTYCDDLDVDGWTWMKPMHKKAMKHWLGTHGTKKTKTTTRRA